MKFSENQQIVLNGDRYRVQERLGRGAVSDVYLAFLNEMPDMEVVLKLVRDDAEGDPLKIAAMEREAEVLRVLNQAEDEVWSRMSDTAARLRRARETVTERRIIALLADGLVGPDQPFVVQEKAPPAFQRFAVESMDDEYRALTVVKAIAEAMALAHRHNLTFKDFAPDTKGDRVRLEWRDGMSPQFQLKLIDWNITGGPEDAAQDLFFFGGHMYYILTGRHVPLDKEGLPPINLGIANPAWGDLTAGSRQIISKALHRDPRRRYHRADELLADVSWWHDTLGQRETSSVFRRLDDRLWQAQPAGQYDRVFAIADLALRLDPPADVKQSFNHSLERARQELEKEIWLPIAEARASLGIRAYEKATRELAKQLKDLPPEGKAARVARIYQSLARVGGLLKEFFDGADERRTPEWDVLDTRAIPALVDCRWRDADAALTEVVHLRPESRNWMPFKNLALWAKSGTRYVGDVREAFNDAENPFEPDSEAWLLSEKDCIVKHQQAVSLLVDIQADAPFEPRFKERLRLERDALEQRDHFYDQYESAHNLLAEGKEAFEEARSVDGMGNYSAAAVAYQESERKFTAALEKFQAVLSDDPTQRRAQIFSHRLQRAVEETGDLQKLVVALNQVKQALKSGEYAAAQKTIEGIRSRRANREDVRSLRAEAEVGSRLQKEVSQSLTSAKTYLHNADFSAALEQLKRFEGWDGSPLGELPGGKTLPSAVGTESFHMRSDLRTAAGDLTRQIITTQRASRDIDSAWGEDEKDRDYDQVVVICQTLEERYPLPHPIAAKFEEARRYLENRSAAKELAATAQGFEDLSAVLRRLSADKGRKADELRQQLLERWQILVYDLPLTNFALLRRRLREAIQLFDTQGEEVFAGMLELVNQAERVMERLRVTEGAERPRWLNPEMSWKAPLARVDQDLMDLTGPQSWSGLRQQAANWRRGLEAYAEGFVRDYLAQIRAQSRNRSFENALEALQDMWSNVPERLRNAFPPDVREDVRTLRQALEARLAADAAFTAVFHRLERDAVPDTSGESTGGTIYTFQEAKEDIPTFRDNSQEDISVHIVSTVHPDVPIEDLNAKYEELKDAAQAELMLKLTPVSDLQPSDGKNYVQVIHTCRRTKEALKVSSVRLGRRYDGLRKQLTEKINETKIALWDELRSAVKEQYQRPETNPRRVLDLYAQARWVEAIPPVQSHEEMNDAQRLPLHTLKKAMNMLAELRELDVAQVERELDPSGASPDDEQISSRGLELLLDRVMTLNNGLIYLPLEKLPPLPENVRPREVDLKWQLSTSALETLKTEVVELKGLLRSAMDLQVQDVSAEGLDKGARERSNAETSDMDVASPESPIDQDGSDPSNDNPNSTARYDESQVAEVQMLSNSLEQSMQRIRELWRPLELKWDNTSELASLGEKSAQYAEIAGRLTKAQRSLVEQQAIRGLEILYDELEEEDLSGSMDEKEDSWLVKLQSALKVNATALRQELVESLGQQVAGILDLPDAAEQLQQQILLRVKARWLGEAAYQAIYRGVDRRAKDAETEGRKDAAQRLWKTVMDATQPWAKDEGSQESERRQRRIWKGRSDRGDKPDSPEPPPLPKPGGVSEPPKRRPREESHE